MTEVARRGPFGECRPRPHGPFPGVHTSMWDAGTARKPSRRPQRRAEGASHPARRFRVNPGRRFEHLDLLRERAIVAGQTSILRTACSTVVWSRPPKRRPISGSERSVKTLARYIATCAAAAPRWRCAGTTEVGTADIVFGGPPALDVLDAYPLQLGRPDQVAHFALGHLEGHGWPVSLLCASKRLTRLRGRGRCASPTWQ